MAALQEMSVTPSRKLFVSLELGNAKWHVAASDGGMRISTYTIAAGEGQALLAALERARVRFGLAKEGGVLSCYEAGRDGFWLHRFLVANGIRNHVVDAASIEVNRRQRRAKTEAARPAQAARLGAGGRLGAGKRALRLAPLQ